VIRGRKNRRTRLFRPALEVLEKRCLLFAESLPFIGNTEFREDPRFAGINGAGGTVVVLDSGVNLNHSFFGTAVGGIATRIVHQQDFANPETTDANDLNGHGSNVTSIIAAEDATGPGGIIIPRGVAPGANIIALDVMDNDTTTVQVNTLQTALQWVAANVTAFNIVAVNMSFGAGNVSTWTDSIVKDELDALRARGVILVGVAGNGYSGTPGIRTPSVDPNVLAVGAVFDNDYGQVKWSPSSEVPAGQRVDLTTGADRLLSISQRHEFLADIFAPGFNIDGAAADTPAENDAGISTKHATSTAAPHVTGAALVAQQLAQQTIGRRLQPDEFRCAIRVSGVRVYDGDDENDGLWNDTNSNGDIDIGEVAPLANTDDFYRRLDILGLGNEILGMGAASRFKAFRQWGSNGPGVTPDRYQFGDFNGDGRTDVITFESNGGMYVWTAQADANGGFSNFSQWGTFNPANGTSRFRLADFNADGRTDVLLFDSTVSAGKNYFRVWLAPQSGTQFVDHTGAVDFDGMVSSDGWNGSSVALDWYHVADVTGDGRSEVISIESSGIYVWRAKQTNDGFLTFAQYGTNIGTSDPRRYRIGFFDDDNRADLFAFDPNYISGRNYFRVWLAPEVGTQFVDSTGAVDLDGMVSTDGWNGSSVELDRYFLGDVNGDKLTDVVSIESNGRMYVWRAKDSHDGFHTFGNWGSHTGSNVAGRYRLGDFNRDGLMDVLSFESTKELKVALSNGSGFGTQSVWGFSTDDFALGQRFHLGDFDGDSRTDVLSIQTDGAFRVWSSPDSIGAERYLYGDFNNDGLTDVLFIHLNGDMAVSLANGTGGLNALQRWGATNRQVSPNQYYVADFNNDQRADVLGLVPSSTPGRTDFRVWLSPSSGSGFVDHNGISDPDGTISADGWNGSSVTFDRYRVADITGDGRSEVITVESNGKIYVWRAKGTNDGFLAATSYGTHPNIEPSRFRLGHFNNDTRPDVFAFDPTQTAGRNHFHVWLSPQTGEKFVNHTGAIDEDGIVNENIWNGASAAIERHHLSDVTQDGLTDVVSFESDGRIVVWQAVANSNLFQNYTSWGNHDTNNELNRYRLGNFNGTGGNDVLVIQGDGRIRIQSNLGGGFGLLGDWAADTLGLPASRITNAKFDSDNRTDLVAFDCLGEVYAWQNTGTGQVDRQQFFDADSADIVVMSWSTLPNYIEPGTSYEIDLPFNQFKRVRSSDEQNLVHSQDMTSWATSRLETSGYLANRAEAFSEYERYEGDELEDSIERLLDLLATFNIDGSGP
jgi:hypothetical protein